jgi:ADP-dependent NAD(P)H-hydrate dehydratase / NAD(P)H-hydrate epimerase
MTELPKEIYSAEQVREIDRSAIEDHGIPAYELMCRAGEAALRALERRWPDARSLAILCGAGNNAGDGYVLARLASDRGFSVRVVAVSPGADLTGAAAKAFAEFVAAAGTVAAFRADAVFHEDLLVDALLGSGIDRELTGVFADAVAAVNRSSSPVLALDLPTGLHADSGRVMGDCISADLTITFVGLKTGLFLGQAADYRGELLCNELGIAVEVFQRQAAVLSRVGTELLRQALPPRRRVSHKGSHGALLLAGGAPGMTGAIRLAAEAALRSGSGLVRVATNPDGAAAVTAARPEIMCQGVAEPGELDALVLASDGIVVGPGLGQSAWSEGVMERLLATELPLVVDADGLNYLAERPVRRGDWVLTPHPGEAARLLGCSASEVQNDRLRAVRELTKQYNATVILKGAGTLVGVPNGAIVSVCDYGNPGMATAGMGDVLAGVVGSLVVQTGDINLAARAGVLLHALAGDAAATDGERGLLAGDLMPHIRRYANPDGA